MASLRWKRFVSHLGEPSTNMYTPTATHGAQHRVRNLVLAEMGSALSAGFLSSLWCPQESELSGADTGQSFSHAPDSDSCPHLQDGEGGVGGGAVAGTTLLFYWGEHVGGWDTTVGHRLGQWLLVGMIVVLLRAGSPGTKLSGPQCLNPGCARASYLDGKGEQEITKIEVPQYNTCTQWQEISNFLT